MGSGQCIYSADYSTTTNFCDLDSLYLTAHPLNGMAPFTFLWASGATTQTISIPLAYGDYLVTITDDLGCSIVINCHIKPFPEVLFYPFNQNGCSGDTVTLFLDWFRDSIPGATYLWSTGETTPTIQITDDIVWSVTVTDPATGCSFVIPPGLFDFHPTPFPEIVGPAMLCTGQSTTLSVTGGPFGLIYWFPNGVYGPTLTVTDPGTYYVYGFSPEAGYCSHLDSIVILPGDIVPPLLTGPISLCTGQSGTIMITNSSLFTEFLWSSGETTSAITINQPGTYSVTVTNAGGCTATENYTVNNGSGASVTSLITPASCGQNNGSVDITPSPVGSYTFMWSNGSSTEDLITIPAGTYTVTVTSVNGCTSTTTAIIPDNPIPLSITDVINPSTSCIVPNGGIDITVSPVGTYTYLWSNGATTEDLSSLAPGNYSVTVTKGINCISTGNYIVTNQTNAPAIQTISSPASCGESNGSIDLQISNGVAPFTFLWSNGNTTQGIINVAANTYSVTVTGSNGCTSVTTVDLPGNTIPISITGQTSPNSSCTNSNGGIDITVSPVGLYTFLWSTGATTEDLTNIGGGILDVTVTLGINCIQTASFIVDNQNIPFAIDGTSAPNTSCTSSNGFIDLTVTPAGSYTFAWNSGDTNEDLQNLNAGSYTVIVTNIDGYSISASFDIINSIPTIDITGIAMPNTSCQNPNGSVDISLSPPGTYLFLWSDGSTTEDLQNISPGSYGITATNTDGCTATTTFTIGNQSASFSLSAIPFSNNSCVNPNGSIDLSVNPPGAYSFLWSNGVTSEDLLSLAAGIFNVTVSDLNQCSSLASFTINDSTVFPLVTALLTPESCGTGNGSIDLTTTPPVSTFLWSDGATTEDLQNINSGTYMVTITGSGGCVTLDTFIIDNLNSNFSISAIITNNSSCSQSNGAIDMSVTPSGTYTFNWSNGATTEDLQNLPAGQYNVTIADALNCTSSLTLTIIDSTINPVISQLITPSTCGQNNGSIVLSVTPTAGNSFLWSNGDITKDLQNILAGVYSVTVTGGNGCDVVASFTIPNNNSAFSIDGNVNANTSCLISNGAIELIIAPAGNYTYTWSNGESTPNIQNLVPGNYTVTVYDQFNCSSTHSFTVMDSTSNPVITQNIIPATCGQQNGSIDISVSPTASIFLWSNGITNEDLLNVSPGMYTVTVTDANGCSAAGLFTIPDLNSSFSISSVITDDHTCINASGAIDLTITPSGQYLFSWSNGAITEDLSGVLSGIYEVTISDINNCSSSQVFSIEHNSTLPLLSDILTHPTCGEGNGSIDLTITPANGNQISWSTGDTSEDLIELSQGVYSVTITDINGCSISSSFTMPGSKPVEVSIDADLFASNDSMVNCSLQLNIPVSMIDTIAWMPEGIFSCHQRVCLEQNFVLAQPTQIAVMVLDTNGCIGFANLALDVDKEFKVYIPNVFSPNGDGPNDMFTVYGNKEIDEVVELLIFDRWGNCVFINNHFPPNEPGYGWNGAFKGRGMNPDVFAYRAVVRYSNGEEHAYKGDVTLIR